MKFGAMRIALGLVVLALGARVLGAQQTVSLESAGRPLITPPDTVKAGQRVRVWVRMRDEAAVDLVGTVRAIGSDTLLLAPHHVEDISVPFARIRHVEISEGRRSAPLWRGTLIGAAIGALAGGTAGVIVGNASKHNAAQLGEAGIAAGFVAGGVIGYLVPGESWHDGVVPRPARPVGSPAAPVPAAPGALPPPSN
jgi:anti-sigma factor RsiW